MVGEHRKHLFQKHRLPVSDRASEGSVDGNDDDCVKESYYLTERQWRAIEAIITEADTVRPRGQEGLDNNLNCYRKVWRTVIPKGYSEPEPMSPCMSSPLVLLLSCSLRSQSGIW